MMANWSTATESTRPSHPHLNRNLRWIIPWQMHRIREEEENLSDREAGAVHLHEHLCEPVPEKAIVYAWFYRSMLVPVVAVIGGLICLVDPAVSLLVYLTLPLDTYLLRRVLSP